MEMKGKNKNKKKKEGREGRNEERGERRNLTSYNKKIGQKKHRAFLLWPWQSAREHM